MTKNNIIFFLLSIYILSIPIQYIYINPTPSPMEEETIYILTLIEKYLDPANHPILTIEEQLIEQYWQQQMPEVMGQCPFNELVSKNLTEDECFFLIEFFDINSKEDIQKLIEFYNQHKK